MNIPTGEFQVIHSDIKELKDDFSQMRDNIEARDKVFADKFFLQDNRIQRLESSSGRQSTTLDKLMESLDKLILRTEIERVQRDTELRTMVRTVQYMGGIAMVAIPALMWLIQHVGK